MVPIPLTAAQIREMDETSADKAANEMTLKVALGFHSNRANELAKRERAWWDQIAADHGLDIEHTAYIVKCVNGEVCIVEHEAANG